MLSQLAPVASPWPTASLLTTCIFQVVLVVLLASYYIPCTVEKLSIGCKDFKCVSWVPYCPTALRGIHTSGVGASRAIAILRFSPATVRSFFLLVFYCTISLFWYATPTRVFFIALRPGKQCCCHFFYRANFLKRQLISISGSSLVDTALQIVCASFSLAIPGSAALVSSQLLQTQKIK